MGLLIRTFGNLLLWALLLDLDPSTSNRMVTSAAFLNSTPHVYTATTTETQRLWPASCPELSESTQRPLADRRFDGAEPLSTVTHLERAV